MAMYKGTLHHSANTVPKWFLETLGAWISILNQCSHCIELHFAGVKRLLADDDRATTIRAGMQAQHVSSCRLDAREQVAMVYVRKRTETPTSITKADIAAMRGTDWIDVEGHEINQVSVYFGYANRTVLGLECSTEGDILGLCPNTSDTPDNWNHA